MEPLSNLLVKILVKFRFSSQKPCLLLNNVFGELVFVTEAPLLEPQSVTVTSRDLRQREPCATVYTIRVTGRSFPVGTASADSRADQITSLRAHPRGCG